MDPTPPDPPDPPDRVPSPMELTIEDQTTSPLSPPMFSQSGTKRRLDGTADVPSEPAKRPTTDPPLTRNQTVYIHPSLVISPKTYSDTDKGPFIVHVSKVENDPSARTYLQAIKFGQFLFKNKIYNVIKDGVKKIGSNRVSVEFKSATEANNFLNNDILSNHKYTASIPSYNVTRMGLIKGIPIDWSMEELAESLEVPDGCGIVLKARRLNRKRVTDGQPSWVPTTAVVVTFKGQILPPRVFCYHTSLPVETYQLPTIQCMNCCRFGHVKAQCKSKPRCFRCSQPHPAESCDVPENKSTCIHCSGPHFALNKSCPEHSRQKSIKIIMSQDNVSYEEAASQFPSVRRSYADTSKIVTSQPSLLSQGQSLTPLPQKQSYRKTSVRPPLSHAPLSKGYDRQAHQNIINSCASSLPNGCALNQNPDPSIPSSRDILLDNLLSMLLDFLSSHSASLPHNVAQKLNQIPLAVNVRAVNSAVELSEHSTQET
ncbi:hypothetical protein ABMA27_003708 [Loxostege sticticalis]|uniref:Gag-like protein n=1 Tax=Loxostege sticticalis TaxID=481309 RepID=A0ABR3HQ05_LOXSC